MDAVVDLLEPAQDALVAALKPIEQMASLPSELVGLKVYQHVPENAQPPMIIIGMMGSRPDSDKGDQLEWISAEVQTVYRGSARWPLLRLMQLVREQIEGQTLEADNVAFEPPRLVSVEAGDAIADGITYVGLSNFEFGAEPT